MRKWKLVFDGKSIGRRVKRMRKQRDWLQRELAEDSGVDPSVIGLIEVGQRLPSRDAVVRLAVSLEVSIDWLLCGGMCKDSPKRQG